MSLMLRSDKPEEATICGIIYYDTFKAIAKPHNFPPNYLSPETAMARMVERLTHPGLYAVVAELDGQSEWRTTGRDGAGQRHRSRACGSSRLTAAWR
jgi:hypothetical protein